MFGAWHGAARLIEAVIRPKCCCCLLLLLLLPTYCGQLLLLIQLLVAEWGTMLLAGLVYKLAAVLVPQCPVWSDMSGDWRLLVVRAAMQAALQSVLSRLLHLFTGASPSADLATRLRPLTGFESRATAATWPPAVRIFGPPPTKYCRRPNRS